MVEFFSMQTLTLVATGFVAGLLGGMLGIGGGVAVMPVVRFGLGFSPGLAAGTTALAVACTTLAGGLRHYRYGHVPVRDIWPIMLSGAASAAVCSLVFPRLTRQAGWLEIGMGCVFGLVALRMLWESVYGLPGGAGADRRAEVRGSLPAKVSAGVLTGVLPGLFGIGTGSLLVPMLRLWFHAPVKAAMGASLVCFCVNAWISAGAKYAQGFVQLGVAVPVCVGCVVGAQAGAALNHRSPARLLLGIFSAVFVYSSARFILDGIQAVGR